MRKCLALDRRAISFNEHVATPIRSGDVGGQTPVERDQGSLVAVGEAYFHERVPNNGRGVVCIEPHEDLVAIRIAGHVHVPSGRCELPLKNHIAVKQLDAGVSRCAARQPGDRHVVVGADVQAVEAAPCRIEYGETPQVMGSGLEC